MRKLHHLSTAAAAIGSRRPCAVLVVASSSPAVLALRVPYCIVLSWPGRIQSIERTGTVLYVFPYVPPDHFVLVNTWSTQVAR